MRNARMCTLWAFQIFRVRERKSKPAPFAEKKDAKDAPPANYVFGVIELWSDVKGCATRRYDT